MLAPNSSYSISSLAALREVNALTSPMSKTQAETVLASFVTKGWLLKSKLRLPSFVSPVNAYLFRTNSLTLAERVGFPCPHAPYSSYNHTSSQLIQTRS
jgi:hypothetical protein